MPINTISIHLKRPGKVYHQGEFLTGFVVIDNKFDLKHNGIILFVQGSANMHFNLRGISFIDSFYGSNKSIALMNQQIVLNDAATLKPGITQIPFRVLADAVGNRGTLYESYHGVFISIQYAIKCCIKRPLFSRDLIQVTDFNIQYDPEPIGCQALVKKALKFDISSDNLRVRPNESVPDFKMVGQLDSSICLLDEPITGSFEIEVCEPVIKSVELQLVRVESCGFGPEDSEYSRDVSEVQNIQIGDGNLLRKIIIPIHMTLPRLFTCPTLVTNDFKIEFELNLAIIFNDNRVITENIPIKLIRSTLQPINNH